LIRAKRSSDNIRDVNDELFEELEIFQEKLLRHSKRKDCEREFISESKNAMNDFQQRLERVPKQAYQTRRRGRETPTRWNKQSMLVMMLGATLIQCEKQC
jgi:DNA replication initiation complex subunit (GINS family)